MPYCDDISGIAAQAVPEDSGLVLILDSGIEMGELAGNVYRIRKNTRLLAAAECPRISETSKVA